MDEDIAIINQKSKNEKIRSFFIKNKKYIISLIILVVALLISYFSFLEYKTSKKIEISELYNATIIEYTNSKKQSSIDTLIKLVNRKDPTYSLLSLYFVIDNSLVKDQKKINDLFDVIIYETSLEKEIRNLVIFKKALYNADTSNEIQLLKILNPIINSKSVWKSHALHLMAEYFFSNGEKQKSKEFFNQIITLENANQKLKIEAQKRLSRDLSE